MLRSRGYDDLDQRDYALIGACVCAFGKLETATASFLVELWKRQCPKPSAKDIKDILSLTKGLGAMSFSFGQNRLFASLRPEGAEGEFMDKLMETLRDYASLRNAICHGSWYTDGLDLLGCEFWSSRSIRDQISEGNARSSPEVYTISRGEMGAIAKEVGRLTAWMTELEQDISNGCHAQIKANGVL